MDINLLNEKDTRSISNVIDRLNYAADLVEYLAKVRLGNGRTIPENLTIDGICFWDFFTAELAHIHIPQVLLSEPLTENFWHRIKPELIKAKYHLGNFIRNNYNTKDCHTWPKDNTILCLAFTNRMYIDILHPLIDHLVNQHKASVTVMEDRSLIAIQNLPVKGTIYQTLWRHWDNGMAGEVSKLNMALDQIKIHIELPGILSNILPKEHQYLIPNFKELFNRFFNAYLPLAVPYVVVARHILSKHQPSIVLTTDTADSRTRIFTSLCNKMGIPCIDIQFGLAGDEAVEWRFLLADYAAVWGDSTKEAVLKQKVKPDRIILTGSPRHDLLINKDKGDLYAERKLLGIPESNAVILLASTYHFKNTNHADVHILHSMQIAISNAAANTPGITLIVKPHPHEDVRETRKIFKKSINIVFAEQNSDIKKLIRLCDAFVSYGSTATIDALVAGKFIICPIFEGWLFSSDIFKDSGAALVPETSEEIDCIFESIANGTYLKTKENLELARKNFINKYVYKPDGNASSRIAALISKMTGIHSMKNI
ncbi:MAG: CDP-glycerol glycerophosphotransferase family protein [Bacteroidetes bacterium]|nr:CDP-glycerol glycerophosphotransferase family protein [Bacteroidota bacterium]